MEIKEYTDLLEYVGIRSQFIYELHTEEPTDYPVWFAVKLVPVVFPGAHQLKTDDDELVKQACVICCERRADNGLWQWCHLTIAAKRVFGDLLIDYGKPNHWYYIVEKPRTC